MPTSGNVAKSGAACLACVPIRLGVFVAAFLTIAASFGAIYLKDNFATWSRMMFGGYGGITPLVGKYCDYIGCVWGLWGIIGAWTMKEGYLQIYNYYNMLRVAVWGYILYSDGPLIWNCEEWALDLDGAIKRHGWNPTMYAVGTSGACVPTRFYFNVFIPTGILMFSYLIWVNIQLQNLIASEPAYLLRLPGVKLDPAYYAYSLGEKSALLGQRSDRRGDLPMTRGPTASGTEKSAHGASAESHGAGSEGHKQKPLWDEP